MNKLIITIVLSTISIIGYFHYQNYKKEKVLQQKEWERNMVEGFKQQLRLESENKLERLEEELSGEIR